MKGGLTGGKVLGVNEAVLARWVKYRKREADIRGGREGGREGENTHAVSHTSVEGRKEKDDKGDKELPDRRIERMRGEGMGKRE